MRIGDAQPVACMYKLIMVFFLIFLCNKVDVPVVGVARGLRVLPFLRPMS